MMDQGVEAILGQIGTHCFHGQLIPLLLHFMQSTLQISKRARLALYEQRAAVLRTSCIVPAPLRSPACSSLRALAAQS